MTTTSNEPGCQKGPAVEQTMPKDQTPKDQHGQPHDETQAVEGDHLLQEHEVIAAGEERAEPEVSLTESLKAELAESKDRLLRLAAEFENFKKISTREQQNRVKFANETLVTALLPIVDSLEQAIVACKKSADDKNDVLLGIEMVNKQFLDVLGKFGVEMFSALGQAFDPSRHEAMGEQIDDAVAPGQVVVEYQKGYFLHGRLVRPARVVLAKSSGK